MNSKLNIPSVEGCIIYYDGSSNKNKIGGSSAVMYIDGKEIEAKAIHLENVTNNKAEYTGLFLAVNIAKDNNIKCVKFLGDSLLVTNQMKGEWKTNNKNLLESQILIKNLLKSIPLYEFHWIPRELNKRADQICYAAMKSQNLGDQFIKPQKNFSRPNH
jgi:ribonuclease HI